MIFQVLNLICCPQNINHVVMSAKTQMNRYRKKLLQKRLAFSQQLAKAYYKRNSEYFSKNKDSQCNFIEKSIESLHIY